MHVWVTILRAPCACATPRDASSIMMRAAAADLDGNEPWPCVLTCQ